MPEPTASSLPLRLARRWWTWWAVGLALAAALVGDRVAGLDDAQNASIPVPSPVFAIEATSNGRTASILNLGIQPIGVPQVPVPVDVDGDLLPDVTVAVNLLDLQGISNPPDVGEIIAPNVEINRFPLELGTTLLGRPSPPLEIKVRFDVFDLEGEEDAMHVEFGYDTGPGGSIPAFFQATLKGIEDLFSPLEAEISTKGDLLGQSADPIWYEGPLTVIGGFEQGDDKADLDLGFAPFPDQVDLTFAQEDGTARIGYAHGLQDDVDLDARVAFEDGDERTEVATRVERLPHRLDLELTDGEEGGAVALDSQADGRLPDIDVRFRGPLRDDVYDARVRIEDLPSHVDASWSLPDDGTTTASFDASDQGIGAIEAVITNQDGAPAGLPDQVFTEEQVLVLHQNEATGGVRVGGRLEHVRSADISSDEDGLLDAQVDLGAGALSPAIEFDGFLDLRASGKPLVDASATVSPLPGHIGLRVEPSAQDEDDLTITYEADASPDIDGTVRLQQPDAATAACGDRGVVCADLRVRHAPSSVEARIFDEETDDRREAFIEVDADGAAEPDLFADVTLGPDLGEGTPLVAHAEILGLTGTTRVRTVEGADETLERVDVHTCDFDYDADECRAGTEDRIGRLDFTVANFLPDQRPDDLRPAFAATPNFATVVARGRDGGEAVQFEATGRLHDIRDVTYLNVDAFGVRTDVLGGAPLAAVVDVDDIRLEDEGEDSTFYDLTADVLVDPLPQQMAFCVNASGQEVVEPTSTLTAECQQANPFEPDGAALARTPLSLATDGSSPFDLTVDAELHDLGTAGSDDRDDTRVRGHVAVEDIPASLRAHVLDPDDVGGGPMLVTVDAPGVTEQVNLDLRAELLSADLQCQDPRVPDIGHKAVCAAARIENLPTRLDLRYEPDGETENLVLDSDGPEPVDLRGLELSSVERDEAADPPRPKVLIAEADVLDLPRSVVATLTMPDDDEAPVAVDVVADPPIGSITGTVRSFVAPDPIPDLPAPRAGLPAPEDVASFIQQGDAFKATLAVTSVRRVGFRNQVTADGEKLDTTVIDADFGRDKDIRAYVDIDEDGLERILGDVTLTDVPAGVSLCFRGPKSARTVDLEPVEGTATFCDDHPVAPPAGPNPQLLQGAFELRAAPEAPSRELDVDAFVRHAKEGGADIQAARIQVDDIPHLVHGTFGDGQADIGAFELDGTPEGIDRIQARAASFDLDDDGWTDATRPYEPRFVGREPFTDPSPPIQHVLVRADDLDFDLRARIGATDGSPASTFHRIQLTDRPCAKPAPVDYGEGPVTDVGPRPDFPFLPTDDGTTYTCIRADVKPEGPSTVDPLALSAIVEKGGKRLAVRDGLLTDIPEFFQLNLADAEPLQDADPRLRPHCVGTGEDQPASCVAPLARLDTPGNSEISAVVEHGLLPDLAALDAIKARDTLPEPLDPAGWGGERGVRARVGQHGGDRTSVEAGVHILVPASLTVDQVGSFELQRRDAGAFFDASDLHVRYVSRRPDGSTGAGIGRLSALVHSFEDRSQILVSSSDPEIGFDAPGELGLDLYKRDNTLLGRQFLQVDGRNSADDFDLRLRLFGVLEEDSFRLLDIQARNAPVVPSLAYSPSTEPSFRLRSEVLGEAKPAALAAVGSAQATLAAEDDVPEEEDCSFLFCVLSQIKMQGVRAQVDFEPTEGEPARLVEAAINTDGIENGLEVRAFQDVDGGEGEADGKVLAGAQLSIDPINFYFHAGIPFLGSMDFVLLSDLDAAASIGGEFEGYDGAEDTWSLPLFDDRPPQLQGEGTNRFRLRQNLFRLVAENGAGSGSRIGPIDFHVEIMHGDAWALFIKLLGIDFIPPFSNLTVPMLDCNLLALPTEINSISVSPNDDRDVVAWPFMNPPLGKVHFSGVVGSAIQLIKSLAGPFFCFRGVDQELMEDPFGAKVHPADPIGGVVSGSTVPDAQVQLGPVDRLAAAAEGADEASIAVDETFTVPADVAWCGTHTFHNLVVPAGRTVSVATTPHDLDLRGEPDDPGDDIPLACPDVEGQALGRLEIVASGRVDVEGAISGDGVDVVTNATGNAGGGHRVDLSPVVDDGRGGSGGFDGEGGTPLAPTPEQANDPLFVASGGAGSDLVGGGLKGDGGGVVRILTDVLQIHADGRISADGNDGGSAGDTTECADPDEGTPNAGVGGGGGGAGGGVVLSTGSLVNDGRISATGGDGGTGSRGGGGGGGGGTVRVITALRSGAVPIVAGGGGGGTICPADFGGGGDARNGVVDIDVEARSRIDISRVPDFEFWHSTANGQELVLPYQAKAEPTPDDGVSVVLCGTHLRPEDVLTEDGAGDLGSQLVSFEGGLGKPSIFERGVTGALSPGFPCGKPLGPPTPPITGPTALETDFVNGAEIDGEISSGTNLPEGYHGLWTVVWKSDFRGNDCFDHTDFPISGSGSIPPDRERFDVDHCRPESIQLAPDVVVGVDNTAPSVTDLTVNGVVVTDADGDRTGNEPILTNLRDAQVSWVDADPLAQILSRQCTPDASTEAVVAVCTPGESIPLDPGDGPRTIGVRVTDDAGNSSLATAEVVLDTTVPVSRGEIVAGSAPLGDNGWFTGRPHLRLFDVDDFGGTGPGTPTFEYQFDQGELRTCGSPADPVCRIDGSPGHELPQRGRHVLRWTTIDRVGNRTAVDDRPSLALKVDDQAPISELLTVPAAPDGANGWFSGPTFVSFGAFDQPGASGFEPNVLEGEVDTAGVFYTHDGVDQGAFDPLQPVRLHPGRNTICWFARDIAGLEEPERCQDLLVDEADPAADLATSGGTLGQGGWFTASPQLRTDVVDGGTLGSGVGADVGPAEVLCAQRPLLAAGAPSGTCISVDGAPFLPVDAATARFTLGEGLHEVRTFTTDRAGRRSPIDAARFQVDLSSPVTAVRTFTPAPSRGRWFRAVPTVVLRAADGDRHSSGVSAIRYRVVNGTSSTCTPVATGFQTYRGPFTLAEGLRSVHAWSVDRAGRLGPCTVLPVAVDLTRPVARATTANPNIWLRVNLLGIVRLQPQQAQLRWTVQENLSGSVGEKVHVDVIVYDLLGNPVRRLDAGDHLVQPGQTLSGQVPWDGRAGPLLGILPLGTYHYRAVVTDAAGNPTQTGESGALVVVRLL